MREARVMRLADKRKDVSGHRSSRSSCKRVRSASPLAMADINWSRDDSFLGWTVKGRATVSRGKRTMMDKLHELTAGDPAKAAILLHGVFVDGKIQRDLEQLAHSHAHTHTHMCTCTSLSPFSHLAIHTHTHTHVHVHIVVTI